MVACRLWLALVGVLCLNRAVFGAIHPYNKEYFYEGERGPLDEQSIAHRVFKSRSWQSSSNSDVHVHCFSLISFIHTSLKIWRISAPFYAHALCKSTVEKLESLSTYLNSLLASGVARLTYEIGGQLG